MFEGLYNSASGLIAQAQLHELIANNIAKASVTGHKRQNAVCREYTKDFDQYMQAYPHLKDQVGGVKTTDPYTIFEQGRLKHTGNPLDIAIEGEGFFALNVDGQELYTRNGRFTFNKEGYLVTPEGYFVLGENGKLRVFENEDANPAIVRGVTIDASGDVSVLKDGKSERIGKLKIVDVEDPSQMQPLGYSLFKPKDGQTLVGEDFVLSQGYLEESNVNILDEMVSMITNMRLYETNQKILKNHSEVLARSVNEIGRV
ncbi:MAG: flagellar basal-body rod protein FlgF [Candidatus Auribacterota bacterium]